MIFEIPEHANWRDPVLQRAANPASDILFPFSEIEDDCKTIESSPTEEARFRTLVCNQWVGHSDAWIASDTWSACGADLIEGQFHRRKAVIGIDFARRYDLAAYSVLIQVDDDVYVFPRFFIPELLAAKKERMDNVPYLRDYKGDPRCRLFVTDGDTVAPAEMRKQIAIDCKNFDITEIRYDPYGMEETRQILADDGRTMIEVTQHPKIMSQAYAHFERLVIQKRLKHPNNPILDWNVGNCKVRQVGTSDQIMLVKRQETARIDGVTSICIGLTSLLADESPTYDAPVLWA
jgi:phage terminase large subunit-like protein